MSTGLNDHVGLTIVVDQAEITAEREQELRCWAEERANKERLRTEQLEDRLRHIEGELASERAARSMAELKAQARA